MPKEIKFPERLEATEASLNHAETALLIVDMQNDFVRRNGRLYVPKAEDIMKPLKTLLTRAREADAHIIYTQDWHEEGDPEFEIWGEHAKAGSWGAEIVDELKPVGDEVVVRKPSYDAFYGTSLDHILRSRGIKNLLLTGVVANICILHTAGSAAMRGYKLFVPIDCILALNEFDYALTLRQMTFIYKARLTRSDVIEFR